MRISPRAVDPSGAFSHRRGNMEGRSEGSGTPPATAVSRSGAPPPSPLAGKAVGTERKLAVSVTGGVREPSRRSWLPLAGVGIRGDPALWHYPSPGGTIALGLSRRARGGIGRVLPLHGGRIQIPHQYPRRGGPGLPRSMGRLAPDPDSDKDDGMPRYSPTMGREESPGTPWNLEPGA